MHAHFQDTHEALQFLTIRKPLMLHITIIGRDNLDAVDVIVMVYDYLMVFGHLNIELRSIGLDLVGLAECGY